jgi:hypothetical protein
MVITARTSEVFQYQTRVLVRKIQTPGLVGSLAYIFREGFAKMVQVAGLFMEIRLILLPLLVHQVNSTSLNSVYKYSGQRLLPSKRI